MEITQDNGIEIRDECCHVEEIIISKKNTAIIHAGTSKLIKKFPTVLLQGTKTKNVMYFQD